MTTTYYNLSGGEFFQDWSNTGLITTANDWSGVPSIVGYSTGDVTSATGVNPQTVLTDAGFAERVVPDQPATAITGAVIEVQGANPTIAFQGANTADYHAIVVFLDSTGRDNVNFSANIRDLDAGNDNAVQQVAVQYRVGETGTWTDLPSAFVADATTAGSATQVTPISVTLPEQAENQAQLQIRILTTNAGGNDELVGIDDIRVTSTPLGDTPVEPVDQPGTLVIADAAVLENAAAGTISFTVSRAGGSDGVVGATYTVTLPGGSGGADAADLGAGAALTGTVSFAGGETEATITLPVSADTDFEPNETFAVTLSAPTGGAMLGDAVATGTISNDDAAPPTPLANVFINEIHYDDAGADAVEGVEIAGAAGTDLTGYRLFLYTGSTGRLYAPTAGVALSGTIADQQNGFGTVSVAVPGLQNGGQDAAEPDGIALVDAQGRVLQFLSYEGSFTATEGPASGLASTDIGVAEDLPVPGDGASLQLTGEGGSDADFTWATASDDSFGQVNAGQTFLPPTGTSFIRVLDASVVEGDAGTRDLVFVVRRAGGTDNVVSVDYQGAFDTADADDLSAGAIPAGTITFAAGESVKEVRVAINGDTSAERTETLSLMLSGAVGDAQITRGAATGAILNDDPVVATIMEVQGAGHQSEFVGQIVTTTGVVTAVDTNGFYLQDATGDGDAATSDAVFVFTGGVPTVSIGNSLSVRGTVEEYAAADTALSVTQIAAPTITLLAATSDLPTATLIGAGGRTPPTETIDDDALTVFDPQNDGIDFWESLEGMRVTLDAPQVVADTNQYGETDVVLSNGAGATGVNSRGGITISPGDFNPEKIQIDDHSGVFAGFSPGFTTGDDLSSVTGVVNYAFNFYEVIVTEAVTVTNDVTLAKEQTALVGDADHLSLASMNVENLAANDPAAKYDLIAENIVFNLRAPDIIAVQEVQDADGEGSDANLSGAPSAQRLIDAITARNGDVYTYVEIAPEVANSTGGAPNGNIRNGYLYKADRVDLIEDSVRLIEAPAYEGTRRPLVAQFGFNGETVTAINVHFTSRGGSTPLYGDVQPPVDAGDTARENQAAAVKAYVNQALASDPDLNVALLGDFNGFYFEQAQLQLTDPAQGGVFTNLNTLLPEEERYSYVFEGNSQQLDNVLVTDGLLGRAQYDSVHINAQYAATNRSSDHDPQVSLFAFPVNDAPVAAADAVSVDEDATSDDLYAVLLGNDGDPDVGATLAIQSVDLSGTLGSVVFDPAGQSLRYVADDDLFDVLAPGQTLVDQFSYTVTDEGGLTSTATVSVTVTGVNDGGNQAGGDGDNTLTGTEDEDRLAGGAGQDKLFGLGGNDTLDGGAGIDQLDGGAGNDRLFVDNAGDVIVEAGGAGVDRLYTTVDYVLGAGVEVETLLVIDTDGHVLTGNDIANRLFGNAGDDRLDGGAGADRLVGQAGDDTYVVDSAGDRVIELAGGGDDIVETSLSAYTLAAEAETLVYTGAGAIIGAGNTLNNLLVGGDLADKIDGKAGDDTVRGLDGDDRLAGSAGVDTLEGGIGQDTLDGGADGDTLRGGEGRDRLFGSLGDDTLDGGTHDDKLTGGVGADEMTGGLGADQFVFAAAGEFASANGLLDRILDFDAEEGDRISLRLIDTDQTAGGDQRFSFIGADAFTAVGQVRVELIDGVYLVQGNLDADLAADFSFAVTAPTPLVAGDFLL